MIQKRSYKRLNRKAIKEDTEEKGLDYLLSQISKDEFFFIKKFQWRRIR